MRMISNFLPGGAVWAVSFLQVHPKGFYFPTMPSYGAAAGIFFVRDSDLQALKMFSPSEKFLWVLVSFPLFFHPCEDKSEYPALLTLPFLLQFFLTSASWHLVWVQTLPFQAAHPAACIPVLNDWCRQCRHPHLRSLHGIYRPYPQGLWLLWQQEAPPDLSKALGGRWGRGSFLTSLGQ